MSDAPVFPLGPDFAGRRYVVYGLARSGLATVRALLAAGAEVVAWDEREEAREAVRSSPERGGGPAQLVERHSLDAASPRTSASPHLPFHPPSGGPPPRAGEDLSFADPLSIDLAGFDGIVVSPGVPINRHPIAAAARAAGVPLIGDIELFAQARAHLPPHKVVGITGTNGKSTTTALVHHILKAAGVPTTMGGNIGLPILAQAPLPEGGVYVLELSSYQIDLTYSLDCDVAVLLNITPDHLDRYESFEAYVAAKARLFAMQKSDNVAVISADDEPSSNVAMQVPGRVTYASWTDIFFDDQAHWPALQGPHNAQNAACAIHVAKTLGLTGEQIEIGLRTYPGLPHRMERIAEMDGVLCINDSKATNAASAAPALAAWPADPTPRIHWIAGGLAKEAGLGACEAHLGNVTCAYLIGEAAAMLDEALAGRVPVEHSGTLAAAVASARAAARPGDVVLLSPAAASFDQFRDFEARGDAFRTLVLDGSTPA